MKILAKIIKFIKEFNMGEEETTQQPAAEQTPATPDAAPAAEGQAEGTAETVQPESGAGEAAAEPTPEPGEGSPAPEPSPEAVVETPAAEEAPVLAFEVLNSLGEVEAKVATEEEAARLAKDVAGTYRQV